MANVDYLLVGAGAGAGGCDATGASGGGGCGEVVEDTVDLAAGSYPVVIGAGGVGGDGGNPSTKGHAGGDSTAFGDTAHGGKGGGVGFGSSGQQGDNGGPAGGGGAGADSGSFGAASTGTFGGATGGYDGPVPRGGGGGGFGQAGHAGTAAVGGNGGDGVQSSITGIATYYGGGGPGGGFSGQGAPGQGTIGQGGGGRYGNSTGDPGHDGTLIARYKTGDFGTDSSGGTKSFATIGGVSYTFHSLTGSDTLILTENNSGMLMFIPLSLVLMFVSHVAQAFMMLKYRYGLHD